MIYFPPLRTERLTVQLQELPMIEAIGLASVPEHANEESATRFLKAAVKESTGKVVDPDDWTVQERLMVITHYMASTMDDGPDFKLDAIGEVRYSHYLMGDRDYPADTAEIGEIEGDTWTLQHLTGHLAAAIERVHGEIEHLDHHSHWLIGRMAAQLVPNGLAVGADGGDLDAALLARMRVLCAYPESVFVQLQSGFFAATETLDHLFLIDTDDNGLIVRPKEAEANQPPARFPARTCLTALALAMGGKPAPAGA